RCTLAWIHSQAQPAQDPPLEEPHWISFSQPLRIVLIGGREIHGNPSHKSATGNIILGKSVFETNRRTAQSVVGQLEVHGRKVTVVDTPGWWWHYPLENTPKLDQIEITNSVYLYTPGPHAFLLVIPVGLSFPQIFKHSLEEHLTLFPEGVFNHTIVLFTAEAPCWRTVEEHIESEGGLQWLVERCGNMYHVLDNMKCSDEMQVTELLEKIEQMWAGNKNPHYEVDLLRAEEIEARKEAEDKMAKRIRHTTQRQSRILRELFKGKGKIFMSLIFNLVTIL
uniref:AIG1-type G domain-containing protein n=1 Tax=Seriola lalandi dorsalis TaxID=1841481 RepID=A0A3B4YZL1_SERLL